MDTEELKLMLSESQEKRHEALRYAGRHPFSVDVVVLIDELCRFIDAEHIRAEIMVYFDTLQKTMKHRNLNLNLIVRMLERASIRLKRNGRTDLADLLDGRHRH